MMNDIEAIPNLFIRLTQTVAKHWACELKTVYDRAMPSNLEESRQHRKIAGVTATYYKAAARVHPITKDAAIEAYRLITQTRKTQGAS